MQPRAHGKFAKKPNLLDVSRIDTLEEECQPAQTAEAETPPEPGNPLIPNGPLSDPAQPLPLQLAPGLTGEVPWRALMEGDRVTVSVDAQVVRVLPGGPGYAGPSIVVVRTPHALRQLYPEKESVTFRRGA